MERFCILFFAISLLSIIDLFRNKSYRLVLFIILFVFSLVVGFRGTLGPDTWNYIYSWKNVPLLSYLDLSKVYVIDYNEPGFLFLSSLIKTICNNVDFYFCAISGLTVFFLYKSICRYSYIYPLIAFVYYCARFMLFRDINQIRAALAIAIVIYSIQYIGRDWKKYFSVVLLASSIHYTSILALPCFFLWKIRLSKKQIVQILICVFGITLLMSLTIRQTLQYITLIIGMKESYTAETSFYSQGMGLSNPMIYFQIIILLLYTYLEDDLKGYEFYYLFRNLYLISTVILILFSSFLVISARLSTIYATLEMFILPQIAYSQTCRMRPKGIGWFVFFVFCCCLFSVNYMRRLSM